MAEKSRLYPDHIYDPRRVRLAVELLQKELRKLTPSLSGEAWRAFDKDIAAWPNGGVQFNLDDENIQDFWDTFDAVLGGIKLKPLFVAYVTAANYTWQKQTIDPGELTSTTILEQLHDLPFVPTESNHFRYAAARHYFDEHPKLRAEHLRINDQHSTDPAQDAYPVIAVRRGDSVLVLDGNRRTLRTVLKGDPAIDAWIATNDDARPRDYWLPINHMLSLVGAYAFARKNGTHADLQAHRSVLKTWFDQSAVARIAYANRVAGQNLKYADKLAEGLL